MVQIRGSGLWRRVRLDPGASREASLTCRNLRLLICHLSAIIPASHWAWQQENKAVRWSCRNTSSCRENSPNMELLPGLVFSRVVANDRNGEKQSAMKTRPKVRFQSIYSKTSKHLLRMFLIRSTFFSWWAPSVVRKRCHKHICISSLTLPLLSVWSCF